jgi:Na+/melibiose symporter-like transporter
VKLSLVSFVSLDLLMAIFFSAAPNRSSLLKDFFGDALTAVVMVVGDAMIFFSSNMGKILMNPHHAINAMIIALTILGGQGLLSANCMDWFCVSMCIDYQDRVFL